MAKNPAREETDKLLEELEKRIKEEYGKAAKEIEKKANGYFKRFEKRDAAKQEALKLGQITQEEYEKWRLAEVMKGDRYTAMLNDLSATAVNADKAAMRMVSDSMADVFAVNANYGAYEVERATGIDTRFSLYNRDSVARLIKDDPKLLPDPRPGSPTAKKLAENKDLIWNRQHMNSAITQGILQGNSMDKIAKRLQKVTDMDSRAAIRNARTMTTSAENAGSMHSYRRAEEMGIKGKKMWMATHDSRTRESHAMMDGETRAIDEEFSNGLQEPGDMSVDMPEEVYNCRCRVVYVSSHSQFAQHYDERNQSVKIDGKSYAAWKQESYEKWVARHEKEEAPEIKTAIVQGKDISETWERRPDEFKFEIQDVINAQGFDGLPRVVSEEEFNRAVEESNFIAQRTYSAPDQETLDMYRNQLYKGEWYVDCSDGGSAYGKGMYSAYSNGTSITEYIEREMAGYKARRGADYNYIETFTLTSDAKTITPNEIIELRNGYQKKLMDELKKRGGWKSEEAIKWASDHDIHSLDDGSVAALFGYDAILTSGIDDYAVILNRTKVIFKEDKS